MENKVQGLNFEGHVTLKRYEDFVELWNKIAKELGWKTSFIVGDPVMPDQSGYFYFTKHSNSYERLFDDMGILCRRTHVGPCVVRKKIELVLYDER